MTGICMLLLLLTGWGLTAWCAARWWGFRDHTFRLLVMSAAPPAQIMLLTQLLSLGHTLTAEAFFTANLVTSILLGVATWRRRGFPPRVELPAPGSAFEPPEPRALRWALWTCLAVTTAAMFALAALSTVLFPFTDPYHLSMPLYWIQNRSIAPFPVHYAQIGSVACLAETLTLPGYFYIGTARMNLPLTWIALPAVVAVVARLARSAGCGPYASWMAGLLALGMFSITRTVAGGNLEMLLSGLWATGALLLLLTPDHLEREETSTRRLWAALWLFAMAMGAKNTVLFWAPALIGAARLGRVKMPVLPRARWLTALVLAISLLISGTLWNYTANKLWYGHFTGPKAVSATLGGLQPQAIWTRLLRGMTALVMDFTYAPPAMDRAFSASFPRALTALGGAENIPGEDPFYSFDTSRAPTRTALGLPGITIFLPSLLLTGWTIVRRRRSTSAHAQDIPRRQLAIWLAVLSTFFIAHAVLNWQSTGIPRLIPYAVLSGTALTGLFVATARRAWWATAVISTHLLMAVVFIFMLATRQEGWLENVPAVKRLASMQNDYAQEITFRDAAGHSETRVIRDGKLTARTVYARMLQSIPAGSHLAAIYPAGAGMEDFFLFGEKLDNHVTPLIDVREPDRVRPIPESAKFMVIFSSTAHAPTLLTRDGRAGHLIFEARAAQGVEMEAWRLEPPR